MKFTSLIALIGLTQAITMSAPDCKQHDDNKDACSEAAGCSWFQGYGTNGTCKAQKASSAQTKADGCKNFDNKKEECEFKDTGCVWTQGQGKQGSCTPAQKPATILAQVTGCQLTGEGKCLGKNFKGDPCVFEEGICQ